MASTGMVCRPQMRQAGRQQVGRRWLGWIFICLAAGPSTTAFVNFISGPPALSADSTGAWQPSHTHPYRNKPRLFTGTDGGTSASLSSSDLPSSLGETQLGPSGNAMTDTLARKAKEKEIAAFKAALPRAHPIFTMLEDLSFPPSLANRSDALYQNLRHRHGNTLTVVAEYWRKAPFAFLGSVLEPKEYSEIYREAGASAIAVNVDSVGGGCAHEDIAEMVAEQQAAILEDVTAPVPIVAMDVVVDPVQISRAKLAGAAGITLRFSLTPPEVTLSLIQTALALGMEPMVFVRNSTEAAAAVGAGARVVYLYGCSRAQAVEMRQDLDQDGVMIGFDLRRPREFQYGLNEVEDAWILRDAGFHSVYVSNLLFQTPLDDVLGPSSVIKALRAKACVFLVDPLDWIEKSVMEGSKETLGELLA